MQISEKCFYYNKQNVKVSYANKFYYYLGMLCFYTWGILLNLVIFVFSIWNMDDFQWNNKIIRDAVSQRLKSESKHNSLKIVDIIDTTDMADMADMVDISSRKSQINIDEYENNENNENDDNTNIGSNIGSNISEVIIEDNIIILEKQKQGFYSKLSNLIKQGVQVRNKISKTRKIELDEIDNFVYGVQLYESVEKENNYTVV